MSTRYEINEKFQEFTESKAAELMTILADVVSGGDIDHQMEAADALIKEMEEIKNFRMEDEQ